MINKIAVQNFRCFKNFQLFDLGHINLIGGTNNAGKTVLLESIFVAQSQHPNALRDIKEMRYLDENVFEHEEPSLLWDGYFYDQETNEVILLTVGEDDGLERQTVCSLQPATFMEKSHLLVSYAHNGEEYLSLKVKVSEGNFLSSTEQYRPNLVVKPVINIGFIATDKFNYSKQTLAKGYSRLEVSGEAKYVLEGLQTIDPSIKEVKVIALGEPNLYVRRGEGKLMPINLFGTAIDKVATIILILLNNRNGTLLIDEVENGIHYTNHAKVWGLIVKLALQFNVQVFATTHSREMVEAFDQMIRANDYGSAARYIEMKRLPDSNTMMGEVLSVTKLDEHIGSDKS